MALQVCRALIIDAKGNPKEVFGTQAQIAAAIAAAFAAGVVLRINMNNHG